MPHASFVPLIPAGGAGTRLWPLSRRSHPKFLLDLTGEGASLLQQTVQRVASLTDRSPLIVTGAEHADAVRRQVAQISGAPDDRLMARILVEPSPRNSMPAIALAAALVEREEPDAVIGSFAADHLISDHAAFARAIDVARDAAELGYLATLGIEPTYPATGFGYIEQSSETEARPPNAEVLADGDVSLRVGGAGDEAALRAVGALPVARFVEKPDRERAEEFVGAGTFSWNAGMFVVRARVLLDELAVQIPGLAAGAREIAAAHGTAGYARALAETWPRLTAIAIDHAVAEPLAAAGKVAVVPAAFDWDDVGDFAALARQLRRHRRPGGDRDVARAEEAAQGPAATSTVGDVPNDSTSTSASDVRVLGEATVDAVASRATVYGGAGRHIALVGLEDVSIVDTEDALLVLADGHAQALSGLVAALEENGRGQLR